MDGTVSRLGAPGGMTGGTGWRLVEWTGRVLLLGAVAFWWGLIFAPPLVSLTFPELLSLDAIPPHLNPDVERNLANAVSATFLLITALLAFGNAVVSRRRALRRAQDATQGWIAAGGWTALAVTATFLAVEEVAEFKGAAGMGALGEIVLGTAYRGARWPVLMSPLILAFVLTMVVFVHKGLPSTGSTGSRQASSGREVRALLILGLTSWVLAVVQEVGNTFVFKGNADGLDRVLEETLEFGGTLVIGLSAGIALRGPGPLAGIFGGRGRFPPAIWLMAPVATIACVVVLGTVAAAVQREPLADARARTHIGTFHIIFYDKHSLVQELGVLPAPPARLDLRITSRAAPQGRSGILIWRVIEAGKEDPGSGRILREGRKEVPARDHPSWESIDFPPLVEAEGRPLALQLIADVGPRAHLLVGATKTNRYQDGRLWVDGALTWPDQNIEFVAYSAPEPTRSKLQAMWHIFSSDWRWPVLAVDVAIAMTLITFIPALLITAALPRRGSRW